MSNSSEPVVLVREAARLVSEELYADSTVKTERLCLFGTRAFLHVCDYYGIPAKALPAWALAVNEAWLTWAASNGGAERLLELRRSQADEVTPMPAAAWSVGIDLQQRVGGYPGHLVAVAEGLLVDTTVIQFSRPDKDIRIPDGPLLTEWTGHSLWVPVGAGTPNTPSDGLILYSGHPTGDDSYRRKWDGSQNLARNVAGRVIRRLRAA